MLVVDLFRRLAYGELSNLALSQPGGKIIEDKHPQLIQYINEGLLRLYSRFILKEKDLIIEQVAHITSYHLRPEYAESGGVLGGAGTDVPYAYIKDLPDEPFTGDVLKVLAVYESGCPYALPLNDQDRADSLFTPQVDVLQVPNPKATVALGVHYQARHPLLADISVNNLNILEQEIELPFSLEGALQNFVGYKIYSHMNGQENAVKSQEYLSTFESICTEVMDRDLVSQSFHTSFNKLEQRGFV